MNKHCVPKYEWNEFGTDIQPHRITIRFESELHIKFDNVGTLYWVCCCFSISISFNWTIAFPTTPGTANNRTFGNLNRKPFIHTIISNPFILFEVVFFASFKFITLNGTRIYMVTFLFWILQLTTSLSPSFYHVPTARFSLISNSKL